jgi:hypothetical protein
MKGQSVHLPSGVSTGHLREQGSGARLEEATTGPVRYASVYLATGAGGRGGAGKKSRRRVGPSGVGTPDPWRG